MCLLVLFMGCDSCVCCFCLLISLFVVFIFTGIFERFRGILHEGEIDKRVQFLIEGLFAVRKAKFQVESFFSFFDGKQFINDQQTEFTISSLYVFAGVPSCSSRTGLCRARRPVNS